MMSWGTNENAFDPKLAKFSWKNVSKNRLDCSVFPKLSRRVHLKRMSA